MRVILGLRQRTSGRQKYKKLQTDNVPRLYILETVLLVKIPTIIKLIFIITAEI